MVKHLREIAMAKIQFRLRDENKREVARVSLVMSCKFKNNEPWQSKRLTSDNAGVAWLEIPNNISKRINWQTATLDIRKGGEKLEYTRSEPERSGRGAIRIEVTLKPPISQPEPVSPLPDVNPKLRSVSGDNEKPYLVTGHLYQPDGKPVVGKWIIAYDRGVCEENILGQNQSRKDGFYEIVYSPDNFVDSTKMHADLIVRAYENEKDKKPIANSALIVRAGDHEIVDLTLGDEKFRGKSLFETMEDRIIPLMQDKEWDCIEQNDLLLLEDRTDFDTSSLAQFVKSQQMAQTFQVSTLNNLPVLFFALLRSGLSPHLAGFLSKPDHVLSQILERAVKQNWIPAENIGQMLSRIRKPRANFLLQDKQNGNSVFKLAGLNTKQSEAGLEFLFKEKHIDDSSWNRLAKKEGFNSDLVLKLRHTIDAVNLLGGNKALMEAAQRTQNIETPIGLTRLTAKDWQTLITKEKVPVPDTVPGKTAAEKK